MDNKCKHTDRKQANKFAFALVPLVSQHEWLLVHFEQFKMSQRPKPLHMCNKPVLLE